MISTPSPVSAPTSAITLSIACRAQLRSSTIAGGHPHCATGSGELASSIQGVDTPDSTRARTASRVDSALGYQRAVSEPIVCLFMIDAARLTAAYREFARRDEKRQAHHRPGEQAEAERPSRGCEAWQLGLVEPSLCP